MENDIKELTFVEIKKRWYLKSLDSNNDDVYEKVTGLNTVLNEVSGNDSFIVMNLSAKPFNHSFELHLSNEDSNGGWYILHHNSQKQQIWLCEVLKNVFSGLPKIIYGSL